VPRTIEVGSPLPPAGTWLRKPIRGGGGQGIGFWNGQPLSPGVILQEYLEGIPASAIFVADGRQSVLLGSTEQLRGPNGFVYGGNLLPLEAPPDEIQAIAEAITSEFGLRGLNGFDFVLRDGRPVVVEVNPRYCASMELIDRAAGVSVFRLHLAALQGALPGTVKVGGGFWGKAIVYARSTVSVGDTSAWIKRGVRDVPHPGEVILKGHPICTVLARGSTRAVCRGRLQADAETIWENAQGGALRSPLEIARDR
jgi:predicted ATP-grasp superfamily ATP-dependent carboligase